MWNTVNANWTAKIIKVWFARSKTAKLHVWVDEALKDRDSAVIPKLISTQVSRIRTLRIITSAALMDNWRHVLDHDAPVIEAFTLYITYPRQQDYDCRLNLTFPASYFHGRPPPLLREFEFSGPHIIWTSPHFRNLTCLRIQGYDRPNRPHVPLAQVLRSLQHLPLLQHLDASGEAFPDDDDNPQNLVVTVPRLKSLRFWGGSERWCPLFTHIVLPFATEIYLCSTSRGPDEVKVLLDHLAVYFRDESGSAGRENRFDSVIMHQDDDGLRLQAECTGPTGRSPLHIDIKSANKREDVYTKFTDIVPVSRATSLCLTGSIPSPPQWKGIVRSMRSLRVLRLVNEACGNFPRAILKIQDSTQSFMHLLRIEIERASFRALISTVETQYFWEELKESVIAIWQSQMLERPGEGHLGSVGFLACDGDMDAGFVRQLSNRGIEVPIA